MIWKTFDRIKLFTPFNPPTLLFKTKTRLKESVNLVHEQNFSFLLQCVIRLLPHCAYIKCNN